MPEKIFSPITNEGDVGVPIFSMNSGASLILPIIKSASPSPSRSPKRGCEKGRLGTPLGLKIASFCTQGCDMMVAENIKMHMVRTTIFFILIIFDIYSLKST